MSDAKKILPDDVIDALQSAHDVLLMDPRYESGRARMAVNAVLNKYRRDVQVLSCTFCGAYLVYEADIAAPGHGQSWICSACKCSFLVRRGIPTPWSDVPNDEFDCGCEE